MAFFLVFVANFAAQRYWKGGTVSKPQLHQSTVGNEMEQWEQQIRSLHTKKPTTSTHKIPPKAAEGGGSAKSLPISDPSRSLPQGTELHKLIGQALEYTRPGNHKLCVMEVGTADGKGTTVQLVKALRAYSAAHNNREWHVSTYEGILKLFQSARWEWQQLSTVKVVNELVMSEQNLEMFVYPHIQGPDTDVWPGKHFYRKLYNGTSAQIAKGEMGAYVRSFPECVLDFVLIDSTRYAHLGIIKTIMERQGLTDSETVWLIENDFWDGGGDERQILDKALSLEFIAGAHPRGEMWPWIYFRVASPGPPKHSA